MWKIYFNLKVDSSILKFLFEIEIFLIEILCLNSKLKFWILNLKNITWVWYLHFKKWYLNMEKIIIKAITNDIVRKLINDNISSD